MKTLPRLCALFLACILLAGCLGDPKDQTDTAALYSDLTPTEQIQALYNNAISLLTASESLGFTVAKTKYTQLDGQFFSETSHQICSYQNYGTDHFASYIDETLMMGSNTVSATELYTDGTAYITVNDSCFSGQMTAEALLSRHVPFSLLDTALYGNMESADIAGRTVISFSQPTAAESWAIPNDAQFTDADGRAVFTAEGTVKELRYSIAYTYGAATVTELTVVSFGTHNAAQITAPLDRDSYITLSSVDAPKLLEKACGYLLEADPIFSRSTKTINCQAGGISRSQTTQLTLSGNASDLFALIITGVTLTNHSRGEETSNFQQTERFQDGIYTIETGGSAAAPQGDIPAQTMLSYCDDFLVGNILLPQYITDAVITETPNTYELTFCASEALAEVMCSNACQILYQNPDLLHSLATSYSTEEMTCYLQIDKYSCMPIACGIRYNGTHIIKDSSYQLTFYTDQTYQLAG